MTIKTLYIWAVKIKESVMTQKIWSLRFQHLLTTLTRLSDAGKKTLQLKQANGTPSSKRVNKDFVQTDIR